MNAGEMNPGSMWLDAGEMNHGFMWLDAGETNLRSIYGNGSCSWWKGIGKG